MAESTRRVRTAWKRLSFARRIRLLGYAALLIAAAGLVVVAAVYDRLLGFWQGFLVNAGTDTLGVAITILILNRLQELAQDEQLKKQLIQEMGSKIRDATVRATEELRARGWLSDGSLEGAYLVGANLRGANLQGAILLFAKLEGANLWLANLKGAHLAKATYNATTHWPDGFDPKAAKAINADESAEPLASTEMQGGS